MSELWIVEIEGRSRKRSEMKREFQKLALASKSIQSAIYTCDALISLVQKWPEKKLPFDVADAFISTIVISYSRPFTDNKGIGTLSRHWRKFANPPFQEAHKEMIRLRNALFAHADPDIHEIIIIPNGCLPPELGPKPSQVAYKIADLKIPPHNVVLFRATCADLQARLETESQRMLAELYDGMELPNREFRLKYHEGT